MDAAPRMAASTSLQAILGQGTRRCRFAAPEGIFQAKKEELPARGQPWGFSLKVLWETLVFDFAVPAPGALALLGLAGLLGTRRRRR